jgi:hypothetical protein
MFFICSAGALYRKLMTSWIRQPQLQRMPMQRPSLWQNRYKKMIDVLPEFSPHPEASALFLGLDNVKHLHPLESI